MSSVTQRISEITQPRGGYLKPSEFECIELDDSNELCEEENIHASLVGLVVDYMTRFVMGTNLKEAFIISIEGAKRAEKFGRKGSIKAIDSYLSNITGVNKKSIINACKAVTFDVWFRNLPAAINAKSGDEIEPDSNTINNIKIMIERSVSFWDEYGPITVDGFTFEGGYTKTIDSGDGDYLTESTLWDFKVSKQGLKSSHTLQLLIYYIMGKHSNKEEFKNITRLGVYNPRTNKVYLKDVEDISQEVIDEVSSDVIGYKINKISSNEDNNLNEDTYLDIKEIMNVLGCSKYMVMKLYNTQSLPLVKKGNKYYISKKNLILWLEWRKREADRRRKTTALIIILGALAYLIVIYYFILK